MYSTSTKPLSSLIILLILFSLIELNLSYKTYHLNETLIKDLRILDRKVIICKPAQEKRWLNLWSKSYLKIDDVNLVKNIHTGYDLASVNDQLSKWITYNYFRLLLNSSTINLPLYSEYCVGLESTSIYHLTYHFNQLDLTNLFLFIAGTSLFYLSNYLSKKVYIYYASYITVGVVGSILILTLILHRFLPKRFAALFVFSSLYLNTYFVIKIKEHLFSYSYGLYLISYILIAAIISFSFAYYRGPIKNHRLYDLFKWGLQFCSLLVIYVSSELIELNIVIMAFILLNYNLPSIRQLINKL